MQRVQVSPGVFHNLRDTEEVVNDLVANNASFFGEHIFVHNVAIEGTDVFQQGLSGLGNSNLDQASDVLNVPPSIRQGREGALRTNQSLKKVNFLVDESVGSYGTCNCHFCGDKN